MVIGMAARPIVPRCATLSEVTGGQDSPTWRGSLKTSGSYGVRVDSSIHCQWTHDEHSPSRARLRRREERLPVEA